MCRICDGGPLFPPHELAYDRPLQPGEWADTIPGAGDTGDRSGECGIITQRGRLHLLAVNVSSSNNAFRAIGVDQLDIDR